VREEVGAGQFLRLGLVEEALLEDATSEVALDDEEGSDDAVAVDATFDSVVEGEDGKDEATAVDALREDGALARLIVDDASVEEVTADDEGEETVEEEEAPVPSPQKVIRRPALSV
jgi:hypothetical protein